MHDRRTHAIVEQGLKILENLDHRGAVGADPKMGDGCGILTQIPHGFFAEECSRLGFELPPAGDYAIGNGGFSGSSIGSSIADTGTTLLYLPDSVVTAYYNQVPTSQNSNTYGGYVFDCNVSPPDFTVQIGNGQFVVPGSYIYFAAIGDGTCFGGIQSSAGVGINIFGDMFLKNQYVIFDQTQSSPRLGFAQGA